MSTETKLLKFTIDTMFLVLLEMNFSPPMREVLRDKQRQFIDILQEIK